MIAPTAGRPGWRAQLAELADGLQRWPWLDTGRTLLLRFREDRLGITAGSLTFTTTIALVPLLTVALAIFSAFPVFASFQAALEKHFIRLLVPEGIARPVIAALTEFASKANRIGTVGFVILVATALMLMLTIDRTLNGIWRVRQPRPIAQRVLVYWAAATLGPLLLGISLTLTSYAIAMSRSAVGGQPPAWFALMVDSTQFTLFALGITGLYRYVPNAPVRWRHALMGGLFAAIGLELVKNGLAWYVSQVPTFSAVYGAFSTVPIFLVWIYLVWVIVLLGAVVAAYAPSLQMRVVRRAVRPGHQFVLAIEVLRELAASRNDARRGLDMTALASALRADPLQLEPILESMAELDWVGRLDEAHAPRYVLLRDPLATPAAPLLRTLLIEPADANQAFWRQAGFDQLTLAAVLGVVDAAAHADPPIVRAGREGD